MGAGSAISALLAPATRLAWLGGLIHGNGVMFSSVHGLASKVRHGIVLTRVLLLAVSEVNVDHQKQVFLDLEGDRYFQRNKEALDGGRGGQDLALYEKYMERGSRVLEIGCANGSNLEYFVRSRGIAASGIDPSELAIQQGRTRAPYLDLCVGTADALPYPDAHFDFVLFGFCLYLVDRPLLSKVVSEADRVLRDSGFMGITDFDVSTPLRRPYQHFKGIHSYKYDYSRLFLAFPHFSLVEKLAFSHAAARFTPEVQERLSAVLLFKDHAHAYVSIEQDILQNAHVGG